MNDYDYYDRGYHRNPHKEECENCEELNDELFEVTLQDDFSEIRVCENCIEEYICGCCKTFHKSVKKRKHGEHLCKTCYEDNYCTKCGLGLNSKYECPVCDHIAVDLTDDQIELLIKIGGSI
jgi:hypothetical protein